MCLIERAAAAGILSRAVDILLETAKRTTQQMHSMEGRMRADMQAQQRNRKGKR